ncbi:MAG: hypothetical protein NT027_16990 [Proteobacteria bacterium]|nr:hypothetical protein [Pseudomonadota bacterium]
MEDWMIALVTIGSLSLAGFLGYCGFYAIKNKRTAWIVFHAFSWSSMLVLTGNPKFQKLAVEYGSWKMKLSQLKEGVERGENQLETVNRNIALKERQYAALQVKMKRHGDKVVPEKLSTIDGAVAASETIEKILDRSSVFGRGAKGDTIIYSPQLEAQQIELYDSETGRSYKGQLDSGMRKAVEQAINSSPSSIYFGAGPTSPQSEN